jgi:hypothetical protein
MISEKVAPAYTVILTVVQMTEKQTKFYLPVWSALTDLHRRFKQAMIKYDYRVEYLRKEFSQP